MLYKLNIQPIFIIMVLSTHRDDLTLGLSEVSLQEDLPIVLPHLEEGGGRVVSNDDVAYTVEWRLKSHNRCGSNLC